MSAIWYTATLAVETPRGRRFQGVTYEAGPREWRPKRYANGVGEELPRGAKVIYRSRLYRHAGMAHEDARNRTIHHNLYHHDVASWPGGVADARRAHAFPWGARCIDGRVTL